MKKSLLIFAAAALIVGCADNTVKNDTVQEQIAIGFVPSFMEKITRANAGEMAITPTNTFNKDGNTFEVWGWKTNNDQGLSQVFDNQEVIYNSSNTTTTTKWGYSPVKYWDRTASYVFYATAPYGFFELNENDNPDNRIITLTVPNDSVVQTLEDSNGASKIKKAYTEGNGTESKACDFLVAGKVECSAGATTQGNANDKDVAFTFSHILSKLTVKVLTTADFSGDNKPYIKLTKLDIKLDSMATTYTQKTAGTVTAAADNSGDTWAGPVVRNITKTCFDVDPAQSNKLVDSLLLSTTKEEIASYLVAPTPNGDSPATCSVTVTAKYTVFYTDGVVDNCTSPETKVATLTSFVQNTHNILNITIAPQAILFDVQTVNGFTPENEYNQDVH